MGKTQRDVVEEVLLTTFPDVLKPLTSRDIEVINAHKDGSFGFSYLGLMLYANGCNDRGKSTNHPQGLFYHDDNATFGVGFFKKTIDEPEGHLHIIAPRGPHWLETVTAFIDRCKLEMKSHFNSAYIRFLSENQYQQIVEAGYSPISSDPWNPVSPSEDETFNHRLVALDDIIGFTANGTVFVKSLVSGDSRNFRKKTKMAYNRFVNFLKRNSLEYAIEPYDVHAHADIAEKMIIEHFQSLENPIGSTAQDYFNLIRYFPENRENEICGSVGFLVGQKEKIPVTLFIGEKVNPKTIALYATFALRNKTHLNNTYERTGYTAISQYSYIRVFERLYKKEIQYVNLGGSESNDLNNFKRQLGAQEKKTFWAVRR